VAQNTRERSLWAWGWRDKFPDDATRGGIAQLIRALLPAAQPVARALPSETPEVPASAVAVPDALAAFTDGAPRTRAMRSRGRAFPDLLAGFAGDYSTAPDLVARPRDPAEVARVLEVCDARGWSCIPFGGGTSVVGGVDSGLARTGGTVFGGGGAPDRPVVTLDLGALTGVCELDATSRLARIAAGTLGPVLEDELATHGLTLRHYPQSFEFSTLGGWLATRAGGHYATGPTRIDEL
jgi:alkyldihydroxyacetonephosphate synthase